MRNDYINKKIAASAEQEERVMQMIDSMIKNNERVTFYSVEKKGIASKTFLYNHNAIRNKIMSERKIE